jgi:hypothetical protein
VSSEERPVEQAVKGDEDGQAQQATRTAKPRHGVGQVTVRRPPVRVIAIAAAVAAVAAAGGAYALTRSPADAAAGPAGPARSQLASTARGPLRVMSVSPAAGTADVNGAYVPVTVTFSAPLAEHSATPRLSPAVQGRWQLVGTAMEFTPNAPLPPSAKITVTVPAGVRSAAGRTLGHPMTTHFRTEGYAPLRLSELLSQLGYMPLSWSPIANPHLSVPASGLSSASVTGAGTGPLAQVIMAESPPPGSFIWDSGYPATLRRQWQPDRANVIEKGALMAFQSQHGMAISGKASPKVWTALFKAADQEERNRAGYTYAITSKSLPETLTIWHDGHRVLRTLANTGIPVAPTVDGTFPVYLRYRFQIMSGTNPDGSSYADPVSFVSYFNGGDAVHYFPRGSYGSQQSLGCVELPYSSAEEAWPYLTYGSLVTVAG